MKKEKFSHIDASGNPTMVDVSSKKVTTRTATAEAVVWVGKDILSQIKGNELITKKGPVFQTATVAGVMGAKKTSELIPFCHPLMIENCKVVITHDNKENIMITGTATVTGKTGVEMEALTAVSIAALTIYDMCKALSHDIRIREIKLMEKTGGKKDFNRK
jgi:cyclic pyranopterin monophosphate synthase